MSDERQTLHRALEKLALAPFAPDEWLGALRILRDLTGSETSQIIGWMGSGTIPFNAMSDDRSDQFRTWLELGGADPAKNPIVRTGTRARVLQAVSDDEFLTEEERKRHPLWAEFYDKLDLSHICFTPLWRDGDRHLMLTTYQPRRAGPLAGRQRRAFSEIAASAQRAALLVRALKNESAAVLQGAFDALSIRVIALDGFGKVVGMSSAAERFLRAEPSLAVRSGALIANGRYRTALETAVRRCIAPADPKRGHAPAPISIAVRAADERQYLLRISSIPRASVDFGFGAAAVVVIEPAAELAGHDIRPDLAAVFTPAELAVAQALMRGMAPTDIAASRGVSPDTVRSQMRNLYSKAGVRSIAQFMAKLRAG